MSTKNENPALKSVPLAIQQKQIVVTCNYEARRQGLHKLQLITEAKKVCPDAVIILGEDLTRFRNASKELYSYLASSIWSSRAERLGFDEVWLDCTDMIDYNFSFLNLNDLSNSFFCLDRDDPTSGFSFDASSFYGPTYPGILPGSFLNASELSVEDLKSRFRLVLGSHLARYLRHELERQKGYTATVGVAINKVLSKLVGNVNKPKNQTTLLHGFIEQKATCPSAISFMDEHDVGKVPGIGFKLAQKIRSHVLGREAAFADELVYGGTKERVSVRNVRLFPGMSAQSLEEILTGPGAQKGIGGKIWGLLHGIDVTEVGKVKRVPSQISQEDSYMKYLQTFDQVRHQLFLLGERLLKRMRIDLTEEDNSYNDSRLKWLAHPRTIRLSTRPRPPLNEDGSRARTFQRTSRSSPLPKLVFNLTESTALLAEKLVEEVMVPMFRKLHPQRGGWNLSLINIAVTNMSETAADSKDSDGRDIGRMFRQQEDILKDFRVREFETNIDVYNEAPAEQLLRPPEVQSSIDLATQWDSEEEDEEGGLRCQLCSSFVPTFATDAHQRYHALSENGDGTKRG